jgi:hypothetical protein
LKYESESELGQSRVTAGYPLMWQAVRGMKWEDASLMCQDSALNTSSKAREVFGAQARPSPRRDRELETGQQH